MNTLFLKSNDEDLKKAADIIKSGGTVIFPTETVYGLGANALDEEAVKKIFLAKGRPSDNPLIVHIYDEKQLPMIVEEVSDDAKKLMDKFWPGPLTIIMPKNKNIGDAVTGGMKTVGVRMPENRIARSFLKFADVPVAAPSANLSGKPSPTTYSHCFDDMNGRVDAIINGGSCTVGVESTVIDLSGSEAVIYRPGDITKSQIERVLEREVKVISEINEVTEKPKSPGLKYKHYSPDAEVYVLACDVELIIKIANRSSKQAGILLFDEQIKTYKDEISPSVTVLSLGSMANPKEAEARLFASLREMDKYGAKVIFTPQMPDEDSWHAVKNRLYRAAGNVVTSAAIYYNNDYMYCDECDKLEKKKKMITFVCTGNTCRSPMAEGLFNFYAEKNGVEYRAVSAGVYAMSGYPPSENAIKAALTDNIDISTHVSQNLTIDLVKKSEVIITMGDGHKKAILQLYPEAEDKVYTFCEYIENPYFLDVPDPYGHDTEYYLMCYEVLKKYVCKIIEKLDKNKDLCNDGENNDKFQDIDT